MTSLVTSSMHLHVQAENTAFWRSLLGRLVFAVGVFFCFFFLPFSAQYPRKRISRSHSFNSLFSCERKCLRVGTKLNSFLSTASSSSVSWREERLKILVYFFCLLTSEASSSLVYRKNLGMSGPARLMATLLRCSYLPRLWIRFPCHHHRGIGSFKLP